MSTAALHSPTSYGFPDFPLNLELDPPSPVKVREWVAELFGQNHLSLAIALAEAGLALYPDSEDVLVIAALVAEVQQDWQHSRELLEHLIQVQAGNTPPQVWHHLARVLRCEGNPQRALSVAQKALGQHPTSLDLQQLVNELLRPGADLPRKTNAST
jgi:tetratricopeptide (TPR) repeat protein